MTDNVSNPHRSDYVVGWDMLIMKSLQPFPGLTMMGTRF